MGRLIDTSDLVKSLFDYENGKKTLGQCIDDTPTAHDATTLMQENNNMRKVIHERVKDGRWEKIGTFLDGETVRCCKCGEIVILNEANRDRYNFCPYCGAKMVKEGKGHDS